MDIDIQTLNKQLQYISFQIMAIFDSRQNLEELLLQKLLRGNMLTNQSSQ